ASALLRRERTGRGGEVEAALMMAALVAQNNSMVRVESVDGAEHAKVRARLAAMRAAGRPFTEQDEIVPSARTPGMVNVYYRTYATKDDVVGVACVSPGLQRAFMEVLGLVDDAPPPALASQTRASLGELGFEAAAIDALLAAKVTRATSG